MPLKLNDWLKSVWIKSELLKDINLSRYGITKTLIMGHRPTVLLGEEHYDIHTTSDGQKIYIDGGAAYGGKLNVLVIEDEEI